MQGVRTRFVRDLLDLIERDNDRDAFVRACESLSSRLGDDETVQAIRNGSAPVLFPMADADLLLLGLDASLGDGTGSLLERAATEQMARLVSAGGLAVQGDLMGSVARLRAPLEQIFSSDAMGFDLSETRTGFVLFLGLGGAPRTARLLRVIACGAVRAAQRFAREGLGDALTIQSETLGERVRLDVRCRQPTTETVETMPPAKASPPPSRKPSKPYLPTTQPTLDVVDRIIQRASKPPTIPRGEATAEREEIVAPSRRFVVDTVPPSRAPRSDTLESAKLPPVFDPRREDPEAPSRSGQIDRVRPPPKARGNNR